MIQNIIERILPLAVRIGADPHDSDEERLQNTRLSGGQPVVRAAKEKVPAS